MSTSEAFLSNVVQIAAPLHGVQDNIVAVKLHPDAVSIMQLGPTLEDWELNRLVTWSLGKDIGRSPIEQNYPYLAEQVNLVRKEANMAGLDAGIAIPAHLFDTRLLTLPYFEEEELAEEAEIDGFWEEQDPELTNLGMKIIRYQILAANESDDRTVVLFSSIPEPTVRRYIGLLIDASLLPVYVENEAFSLINGIYTRLDAEKRYEPSLVLHICPGANMVVGFEQSRVVMQKISISDFDEALLLEIEDIEEVAGEFWEEVAIRIGEQIKQAVAFLHEERDFPNVNRLLLVSEHKNMDNMHTLLHRHIGAMRLQCWDALKGVDVPSDNAAYVDYFRNPSVFTSALGLATQGLNVQGKSDDRLHPRFLHMNFLPDVQAIRRNRRFGVLNKLLLLGIGVILAASFFLIGVTNIPTLIASSRKAAAYEEVVAQADIENLRHQGLEKKFADLKEDKRRLDDMVTPKAYTHLLAKLAAILPPKAELETLTIDADSRVTITGFSQSTVAINRFANNIVNEGLARSAPVQQSQAGKFFAFTISTKLVAKD